MRLLTSIVLVAAASLGFAAPAAAQNLGQILGTITGLSNTARYSGCSYQTGVYAATCQLDRVRQIGNQISDQRRTARANQDLNQARVLNRNAALQRACEAGDQESCSRSHPVSARAERIASALMEACRSGDDRSCERADAIRSQGYVDDRQFAYRPSNDRPTAYRTASSASTGYRTAPDYRR
jgi:hypothetical protein